MNRMKKLATLVALIALSSCTLAQKEAAKTVLDVARNACSLYAAQTGVSVQDVCATEEQLRPFIDSILAAQRAAGAQRTAGVCAAPAP